MSLFAVSRFLSIFSIFALLIGAIFSAAAADLPPMPTKASVVVPVQPSGWSFEFTPYLWAAGLKGTVDVGPVAPAANVDVGFVDILKHMKMAFMGTFETRYDKWGLIADLAYLSVKASATGPLGFTDATLKAKTFFGTFAGAYRFVDQPTFWIDGLAGARVWRLSDTLDITAPGPIALSATRSATWVDPIIGVRARVYMTPEIYAELYGDAGGFGIGAKSDWQVAGLLGYRYSKSMSFFAGYRHLAVAYNRDNFVFDVDMSGPMFGASFKF
jgi:hypothetical protein